MAKVKLVPRSKFCELLELAPSKLRTYISRGKLKESQQGFLNVFNPANKEWIIDYCDKRGIDYKPVFIQRPGESLPKKKNIPEIIIDDQIEEIKEYEPDDSSLSVKESYSVLRDKKLKKEVEKLEIETRLKTLELEKKRAKIVPIEFVVEMMQRYLLGTCGGIINSGDLMVESICDEFNAEIEVKLEYKKRLRSIVNDTIKSKHEPVSNEIVDYAKEYALSLKW